MPPTNSWCYHDNNKVATQTKCIFRHPPTISNCMQNLRGGQNFSFPTFLDSYRELLLKSADLKQISPPSLPPRYCLQNVKSSCFSGLFPAMGTQRCCVGCGRRQISCSSLYSGDVFSSILHDVYCAIQRENSRRSSSSRKKIREMLLVIYPTSEKPIDENNYAFLLDLAKEYMMAKLTEKCESYLIGRLGSPKSYEARCVCGDWRSCYEKGNCLQLLAIAQTYGLDSLETVCIQRAKHSYANMKNDNDFDKISDDNCIGRLFRLCLMDARSVVGGVKICTSPSSIVAPRSLLGYNNHFYVFSFIRIYFFIFLTC